MIGNLLGALIGSTLGARPKSHFGASRFLRHGSGSFLNGSSILTAAALGWAGYEIWRTHQPKVSANPTIVAGSAPSSTGARGGDLGDVIGGLVGGTFGGLVGGTGLGGGNFGGGPRSTVEVVPDPIDGTSRIAGLLTVAARADGELGEEEYACILREAKNAGASAQVMAEMQSPRPLEALVAGVRDPKLASDLYVLAFAVVRADEDVNAKERAFLDKLGSLLGLDKGSLARLESDAVRRIAAAS
jgi:uncharacterized membrane protein YebE (DUF533 family)